MIKPHLFIKLRLPSHSTELLSVAYIYIYSTFNVHPITNAMWNVSGFYDSHLSNIVIKLDFTPMNYIMMKNKIKMDSSSRYSLHDVSSDPSVQSLFPSHIHANGMHSPLLLLHVKSSDVHTFASAWITIFLSS